MKAQNTLNNNNNSKKRITKKRANKRKRRGSDSISNGNIKVGKKHRTTRNTRKKLVSGGGKEPRKELTAVAPGSKTNQQSNISLTSAPPLKKEGIRLDGKRRETPMGTRGKSSIPDASGADNEYFSKLIDGSEKEFNDLQTEIKNLDSKYKEIEPIKIAKKVTAIGLDVIKYVRSKNKNNRVKNTKIINININQNVRAALTNEENKNLVGDILKFLQENKSKNITDFIDFLDDTYKGKDRTLLDKLVSFAKDTYNEGEAKAAKRKKIENKFRESAVAAKSKQDKEAAEAEEERQRLKAEAAKQAEAAEKAEEERQRLEAEAAEKAEEERQKAEIINSLTGKAGKLTEKAAELTEKAKLLNEKAQLLTGNAEAAKAAEAAANEAANEADKAIAAANEAADKSIVKTDTDINILNAKLEAAEKADDAAEAAITKAEAAVEAAESAVKAAEAEKAVEAPGESNAAAAAQESAGASDAGTPESGEEGDASAQNAVDPSLVELELLDSAKETAANESKLKELKNRLQKANAELPKINNVEEVDDMVKEEVTAAETALTKAKAAVAAAEINITENNVATANTAVETAEKAVELAKSTLETAISSVEQVKEKVDELLKSEKYENLSGLKKSEIYTIKAILDKAVKVQDALAALNKINKIIDAQESAPPGQIPETDQNDELNKIYSKEEKTAIKKTTENLKNQIEILLRDIIVKKEKYKENTQIIELLNKAFEKAKNANKKVELANNIFDIVFSKDKKRIGINNDYTKIDYLNKIAQALINAANQYLSVVDELVKKETPETLAKVAEASEAAEEAEKNVANIEDAFRTYELKKDASNLTGKKILKKQEQAEKKAEEAVKKAEKEAEKKAKEAKKIFEQQQAQLLAAQQLAAQARQQFLEQQQEQLLAAQAQQQSGQPYPVYDGLSESAPSASVSASASLPPAQQKIDDTLGVTTSTTTKPGPGFNEVHIVVRVPHQYSTNVTGELSTTAATNLADLTSDANKSGAELKQSIDNTTGPQGTEVQAQGEAGLGDGSVAYGPSTEAEAALGEQAEFAYGPLTEEQASAQQQDTSNGNYSLGKQAEFTDFLNSMSQQQEPEEQLAQVQAAEADGVPADGPQAASVSLPAESTEEAPAAASTEELAESTEEALGAAQQTGTPVPTGQQTEVQEGDPKWTAAQGGKLKIPKNGITPKRGRKQQSSILRRKTIPKRKRSKK